MKILVGVVSDRQGRQKYWSGENSCSLVKKLECEPAVGEVAYRRMNKFQRHNESAILEFQANAQMVSQLQNTKKHSLKRKRIRNHYIRFPSTSLESPFIQAPKKSLFLLFYYSFMCISWIKFTSVDTSISHIPLIILVFYNKIS